MNSKKNKSTSTSREHLSYSKQCLGLDVSKDKLDACFSKLCSDQSVKIQGTRVFSNTSQGWKAIVSWVKRFIKNPDIPFVVVLEATGVYHEGVAYYLKENGIGVCVTLPNKSKNYARSLNVKTKTDRADAQILARMGLERKMDLWQGPSPILRKLKRLTRERDALLQQKTIVSNQLHANKHEYQSEKMTIKRRRELIKFIDKQIKLVELEIQEVLDGNTEFKQRIENVCTLKGVGTLTAVCVVAEANGFDLIENKNQLVSYAGYDVVERQSGTSLKGKTRISKKGNSHIRKALYFPALSASRHEPKLKNLYERVVERNPKVKMIGAVAVQRKLLVLIYTLYKTNKPYDSLYEENKQVA
jgi:transposase